MKRWRMLRWIKLQVIRTLRDHRDNWLESQW